MRSLIVFFVSLFVSTNLFAQVHCGTDEKLAQLIEKYPELKQARQLIEQQAQDWIANGEKVSAVITIPVVVHVVYNTSTQNISNAQILSQLEVLNEDYRKLNANASNTPSEFQGLAADVEVEFCLASRDPNGNWTDGITRTETDVVNWNGSDLVKSTSDGGKDGWEPSKYLNIWVCNIGSGLLGYAYPPGVPSYLDGVVIGYKYFGKTGTLQPPYNKGRTTTHEIGHWLGLSHLWGNGLSNTNCNASDNVSDTPAQADPNYGCPSFPHESCNNGPNGDMFMNFLDYTNDACMTMFTTGQKQKMLAVLNSSRSGIKNSDVICATVGVAELDNNTFDIYPNPTNKQFTIELKELPHEPIFYTLVNSIGLVMARATLTEQVTQINIADYQAGVYFMTLETEQGQKAIKKLLITH